MAKLRQTQHKQKRDSVNDDMRELRAQNQKLRRQNARLRREAESLALTPPPSDPTPMEAPPEAQDAPVAINLGCPKCDVPYRTMKMPTGKVLVVCPGCGSRAVE